MLTSRLDKLEERISELKDNSIENMTEMQRGERMKCKGDSKKI